MSSVTSAKGASAAPVDGFRPWHFFVLASLMAATAAVVISRETTPEHLILISLIIAASGFAAAGFYRMLAPLVTDESVTAEPLSDRTREALEREKALTLRSIKELEFDRAMGKVSDKDFDEIAGRLRARAMTLMKQLDEGQGARYRERIERELAARMEAQRTAHAAAPVDAVPCAACGTGNDSDAAFCKRCGARIAAGAPGGS